MIKSYLITTSRSLFRNRTNSFINIIGLSLGIACGIVLFLLAAYYNSFNKFEENYDNIYRIVSKSKGEGGETNYSMGVPLTLPDAVREDFPEFKEVVLTMSHYGAQKFTTDFNTSNPVNFDLKKERIVYTDNNYFKVFSRNWLHGNEHRGLRKGNDVVISVSLAQKLFGTSNALGKSFLFNNKQELSVQGVVEDPPATSDMPFTVFISLETIKEKIKERASWESVSSDDQCYVLLPEGDNPDKYLSRFVEFEKKYDNDEDNPSIYHLQPASDLHFSEFYSNYNYNTNSKKELLVLVIIGVFLILTACVNFINLSTAIAVRRSREVGVRKVLGGTRYQLAIQFMGEAFVIILLSMICALGLAELIILYLNPFLSVAVEINFNDFNFALLLVGGLLFITFFSGFYPALVLSGFKPSEALKNKISSRNSGGISLRKGLVVFQFFISQVLIIGTLVTINQLDYLENVDLGFNEEGIIHLTLPNGDISKMEAMKTKLNMLAGVKQVSLSFSPPSSGSTSVTSFKIENDDNYYYTSIKPIDTNYINLYEIEMLAGRNLNETDTLNEIIVNEKLLRDIGYEGKIEELLGRQVLIYGNWLPVVGVIRNFNSTSLHEEIMSTALFSHKSAFRTVAVKIDLQSFQRTNQEIERMWNNLYPGYQYDFLFYDEQLREYYEGEQKMSKVFAFFSLVAIIVGCLGLFGLSSYMVNQKIKEIGVRKTLGATVRSIVMMFSWSFIKLVVLAFLFAVPLAWYIMNEWLQEFQYHIDLSPILFLEGLLLTLLIAAFTVGYKSLKAALANPVKSLKDE